MKKTLSALLTILLLAACSGKSENIAPSAPQQTTDVSVGHYCTMNLSERNGPKAQVFLSGKPDRPVWFSTIKQMSDYIKPPEEPKGISMIYVTDMGKVTDWTNPSADNVWIDMKKVYYVTESGFVGGVGAEDAPPFADKAQAEKFAQEKGDKVVGLDEMPEAYIFKQAVQKRESHAGSSHGFTFYGHTAVSLHLKNLKRKTDKHSFDSPPFLCHRRLCRGRSLAAVRMEAAATGIW